MKQMTPLETIEVLENVEGLCRDHEPLSPHEYKAIATAIQYLRKIAKGELKEVVRGEWIKQNYIDEPVICSNCKCCPAELQVTDGFLDEKYPYCPYCGAKMEGECHE